MTNRFAAMTFAAAIAFTTIAQPLARASTPDATMAAGSVRVIVSYKGKGNVDSSHRLWVWLFDTPNIGAGSMPIAELSIDKNGGVAVFDNVAADEVWVAAAYDENGVMSGNAPPPPGTPVGVIAEQGGAPTGVKTGDKAEAKLTFDDSFRMP